jgi:hypothetical protein
MNRRTLTNDTLKYLANVRAEDGLQPAGGWAALRDAVVIPAGLFLALFLLIVLVLFTSHTAFAQTGTTSATGWAKHIRTLSVREFGSVR